MDAQALTPQTFNADNVIFEEVKECTAGAVKYFRVPIKYRYVDGPKADLCVATPELLTWGIQENRERKVDGKQTGDKSDNPVQSFSLPLIMTDEATNSIFEQVLDKCKEHLKLPTTKKALGKYNMAPDTMDVFYHKREDGELVIGAPPTLYAKMFTKKNGNDLEITTQFYRQPEDELMDPKTLIGVQAKVVAAIFIKDIYVGVKPSIQIKVNDVNVIEIIQRKRMLTSMTAKPSQSVLKQKDESEEETEEPETAKPKVNKIVRRKVPA